MAKRKSGMNKMKLIAIKKECYAISGVETTSELKHKYVTLCKNRDFRKRKTWEYVLKILRTESDWIGIRVADVEKLAAKQYCSKKSDITTVAFHPRLVDMDAAANNDD